MSTLSDRKRGQTDARLVEEARAGDKSAFAYLVERHLPG